MLIVRSRSEQELSCFSKYTSEKYSPQYTCRVSSRSLSTCAEKVLECVSVLVFLRGCVRVLALGWLLPVC